MDVNIRFGIAVDKAYIQTIDKHLKAAREIAQSNRLVLKNNLS